MRKSKVAQLASVFGGAAVAVSSVMSPVALADGHGPQVYGRIDVAIENADVDNGTSSDDVWSIESKSSRLGFKGEEKLSDAISAIYQYEIQIQPEDNEINDNNDALSVSTETINNNGVDLDVVTKASSSGSFLKARNQFVGLKGGFGVLRLGRMDTPLKKAQGKVDLFADHIGELDGVFNKEGDNRLGDQINYTTPKIAGAVTAQIALLQGEDENDIDGDGASANDDGLGDGFSANVIFQQDNLFLAAAVDSDVNKKDAWRIAGQVTLDAIKLGALYQVAEDNFDTNPTERAGFILSAAYDMDGTVFMAQYGDTEKESSTGATLEERSEWTLGVHKNYSKTTTVYAEMSDYTVEAPATADVETFTVSTGIRKKF